MRSKIGLYAAVLGASLPLTGCPLSTTEKPTASVTNEPRKVDTAVDTEVSSKENPSDTEPAIKDEEPFPVIVRLPKDAEEKLTEQQKYAVEARRKLHMRLRTELVRVNFFPLSQQTLVVNAFDKTFTLVKTGERKLERNLNQWLGVVKECNNSEVEVWISESKDDMSFAIRCEGLRYRLDGIPGDIYLMMEEDPKLRSLDFKEDRSTLLEQGELNKKQAYWTPETFRSSSVAPVLRVLLVYTSKASESVKDTIELSTKTIASINQSFSNSKIDYTVELAGSLTTDYEEDDDVKIDLDRFRIPDDDYMDEIHDTRSALRADVAVLIRNAPSVEGRVCGKAAQIDATKKTAFATVDWQCVNPDDDSFSFAHEIGHLHGCRHQPEWDSSDKPFAYGHGYVVDGKWRTIMAAIDTTDDPPECPNGCDRVNYWSSPDITKDKLPMGTAATHDNARVMRTRSATLSVFLSPQADEVVPEETLEDQMYKDYFATDTVGNSSDYTIDSGAEARFHAKAVSLKIGFHAKSGSRFTASRVL